MHVRADLHIHTQASDGDLSPEQIISLAEYSGLDAIAVTDHDTLSGAQKALVLSESYPVKVIPGVEISIAYDHGTLHILGYFPTFPAGLETILGRLQRARTVRLPRIIEKLRGLGMEISVPEVERMAGDGQIGRPHIAKVLVEKGYVSGFDSAFSKYLGKGRPAYVEKDRMGSREAIETILDFSGLPVLAHPYTLNQPEEIQRSFIEELAGLGLKGIEIFYPDHTKAQKRFYGEIARDLGLVQTGGTDFHGSGYSKILLGSFGLDTSGYERFLEALHRPPRWERKPLSS